MSDEQIFEPSFADGIWTGIIPKGVSQTDAPEIGAFLDGRDLGNLAVTDDGRNRWRLEFPIPAEVLGDGVSTFVFIERQGQVPIGRFCVIAGTPAAQNVLAQLDALQAELDQLKSAFRREARRNRDKI